MERSRILAGLGAIALLATAAPAAASFHLMQIQVATGGFCGDTGAQAIQLRMRSGGQNFVSGTRLVAYDADGANPVTLLVFPGNVPTGTSGSTILAATAAFAASSGAPAPDFTLANPIPASYLDAGRLTFESGGSIYWSLAWGGLDYAGPHTGTLDNDPDGNFGPGVNFVMPSSGSRSAQFDGTANQASSTNLADYVELAGPTVWTNNAGVSGAAGNCLFDDSFEAGDTGAWSLVQP